VRRRGEAHLVGGEGISDGEDAGTGCGGGVDCFCC
jgi:hypothetical protein